MAATDKEERAEAALRHSEARARRLLAFHEAVVTNMGEGLYAVDRQGLLTYMNPAAETILGWKSAELVGRKMHDATHYRHPDGRPFPIEECAGYRVLHEGKALRDYKDVFIRKDGTFFPVVYSSSPLVTEENVVGLVVVFRDATERDRAEEAQARLAAIVESSQDAIVSKTVDGTILSWNAGAERLFGYTAHEAIGRPITLIIPPDRRDEEHEILARILRGLRVEHFETVRVSKHGRLIDISLTISPVRDSSGRIIGVSKIARDITDRKRIEESLRESDRRKDQFLAVLAHELRNPLAPLRNGLQAIRLAADDPDTVAQTRVMMERQLEHMVRIVDDLLDTSRISQNKIELRRARVLLADVVSSAIETAGPTIEAGKHQLTTSLPPEPVYLDADLTRLSQILSNLLTNSAKYTDPGGHIWLTAERDGSDIVVSVRDNGIGIPAASLPRIFEMFSQVDRSFERSTGGLGIGLALVRGLVEMHGGTVAASSEGPGKGSTFTVRIPAQETSTQPEASFPLENDQSGASVKRRILVVDDNKDSANSLAMLLEMTGNETRTAFDGLEAVDAATTFRPDAILLDIGLPKLNGYDVCQRIREQSWGKGMVLIALTGWAQAEDKKRSRDAGFNGHLVKPVKSKDIVQLLAELLPSPVGMR